MSPVLPVPAAADRGTRRASGGCYGPRPMSAEGPSRDASGDAWSIIAYLLSGLLVWGGAGLLADHLAGTPRVFTLVGLLLGMASGLYLVYVRFGRA